MIINKCTRMSMNKMVYILTRYEEYRRLVILGFPYWDGSTVSWACPWVGHSVGQEAPESGMYESSMCLCQVCPWVRYVCELYVYSYVSQVYLWVRCVRESGVSVSQVGLWVRCVCKSGVSVSQVFLWVKWVCESGVSVSQVCLNQICLWVECAHQ